MSHFENTFTLNVENKFTVKATIDFHDHQDFGGFSKDHVIKTVEGDYPQETLDLIKDKLGTNEDVMDNLFNYDEDNFQDKDEPLDVYLNINGLTCEDIQNEANKLLEYTGLEACVFETDEAYESDDLYNNLSMFEAYLVNKHTDDDIEDTTTGRYCDLGSVRDEILATAKQYGEISIAIQRESSLNTFDTVRYFAVGKTENDLFTGIVYGYEGGGEYSTDYMHKGKYVPYELNDEFFDDDTRESLLNEAAGHGFIALCNDIISIHCEYDKELSVYKLKDTSPYKKKVFKGFGEVFTPPNYANTTFDIEQTIETYSLSEFFIDAMNGFAIAKETAQQHHDHDPELPPLSFATLVEETVRSFRDDEVYEVVFDDETENKTRVYLDTLFNEMEKRCLSMDDVDFRECDICTNCGKVLLSDDELYESPISGSLCQSCSIMCDGCDLYHAPKEIVTFEDADLCPKCYENHVSAVEADLKTSLRDIFCPHCLETHPEDPNSNECTSCGYEIPDGIMDLYDTIDEQKAQIETLKNDPLYGATEDLLRGTEEVSNGN